MKTIEQVAAEILVASGYAKGILKLAGEYRVYVGEAMGSTMDIKVDPFTDTLEARRQADALEDWLYDKHGDLVGRLFADGEIYKTANRTHSEWRRFNIKWCFEQLAEKDDE